MLKPYIKPELKLAGDTDDVVLGSTAVGNDLYSQRMPPGMEFEDDELESLTHGD